MAQQSVAIKTSDGTCPAALSIPSGAALGLQRTCSPMPGECVTPSVSWANACHWAMWSSCRTSPTATDSTIPSTCVLPRARRTGTPPVVEGDRAVSDRRWGSHARTVSADVSGAWWCGSEVISGHCALRRFRGTRIPFRRTTTATIARLMVTVIAFSAAAWRHLREPQRSSCQARKLGPPTLVRLR